MAIFKDAAFYIDMKKFLLVLVALIFSINSAMAFTFPRWSYFPLNVYIQQDSENQANKEIVKRAFQHWQSNSGSILKFLYKSGSNFAKNSQVIVSFTDTLPNKMYYSVGTDIASRCGRNQYWGFFRQVRVVIKTREDDGRKIPRNKLYAISLQAVGRAMGVNCTYAQNNVMSCNNQFKVTSLTEDDIRALELVYRYDKDINKLNFRRHIVR